MLLADELKLLPEQEDVRFLTGLKSPCLVALFKKNISLQSDPDTPDNVMLL